MIKKNHPLYSRWKSMMERCYVKNNYNYKYYGAKGVTVDENWHNFEDFVHDVNNYLLNGHLLYKTGYHLDKDIKGGKIYSLDNCVVISAEDNQKLAYEKQQRKIFAIKEDQKIRFESISKASRDLGIPRNTIQFYLKNGKQHSAGYFFKYCS